MNTSSHLEKTCPNSLVHPNAGGTVRLNNLSYTDEVLWKYSRSTSPYPAKGNKWPIKADPRDRNFVHFQDPETNEWHAIRWDHATETTVPFTDRTHTFLRRQLRAQGDTHPSEAEIAEALRELQDRMDVPQSEAARHKRRAVRDAERSRHAARDRERAGLAVVPDPAPDPSDLDGDDVYLDDIEPLPVEDRRR